MRKIIFIAIMVGLWACQEEQGIAYVTGMENKTIPPMTIQMDTSKYLNVDELAKRKKIVLFYFSPTCPYCKAQMKDMVDHIGSMKNRRLVVVTWTDLKSIREFAKEFKLEEHPQIYIGRDTGMTIARTYKISAVPFTAIFNGRRKLVSAYQGKISANILLD